MNRWVGLVVLIACVMAFPEDAGAQVYPSRPIRLIVRMKNVQTYDLSMERALAILEGLCSAESERQPGGGRSL